ncbi:hypothetical protein BT96DRAFT_12445 [Gymnopus androsaceus JB14]|uniref:Uncharacterized protein n=1 Tax=Gymnopus androsaceus JB14 TaxID=1447944 RepID=A0A6A4ILY5_9AGAR|nr:hypothetical protein BT96DRAFT_12445 [Gymnopus androsaceus JB14]
MTLEKKPEAYWVIGASKLLCAGCHTIIAKAYPEVLQANPQTGLKPIAVHGCHGKLYRADGLRPT